MPLAISRVVENLEASATLAMAAKAKELARSGKTVYDFSVGEPDFPTPPHICDAAVAAMRSGHTHYTAASGILELKQAVAKAYRSRHGLEYGPQQVVISNGAKHCAAQCVHRDLQPGRRGDYPGTVLGQLCGTGETDRGEAGNRRNAGRRSIQAFASPIPFGGHPAHDDFADLFAVESYRQPLFARGTGALADIVLEKNLSVVSDEIYERLIYGRPFASFPTVRPGLQERTVVVNGVSKAYAMTGWRIGWTLSPPKVAAAMADLQSQETSNPASISQYAALAAVEGPQECVEAMRDEFARRRQYVEKRLAAIPQLKHCEIGGAFYAFVDIRAYLGRIYGGTRIDTSAQWCLALLNQQQVATVMGSAFGAEGYIRISFAASLETLTAGFDRIEAFLRSAV